MCRQVRRVILVLGILILTLLPPSTTKAQDLNWVAAYQGFGTTDYTYVRSLGLDSGGRIVSTGSFTSQTDFDPGSGELWQNSNQSDIFINTLSSGGTHESLVTFGGVGDDEGRDLAFDTAGNLYLAGTFSYTVDFDPDPVEVHELTSAGLTDVFVVKLNPTGDFVWARSIGGASTEQVNALAIDSSGNVLITGYWYDTADFDPGIGTSELTSAGASDAYILRLDASGNFVWVRAFTGAGSSVPNDITLDVSGNIYTTGYFDGTVDFNPGPGTFTRSTGGAPNDAFISKLTAAGEYAWVQTYTARTGQSRGVALAVNSSGVYTTGTFNQIGPDPATIYLTSKGGSDVFLSRHDLDGNQVWIKQLGGTSNDEAVALSLNAAGEIYTVGSFYGTIDLDPGPGIANLVAGSPASAQSMYVSKLDADGVYLWARGIGGTAPTFTAAHVQALALGNAGAVYTGGYFTGAIDFDPLLTTHFLTSSGAYDGFVQALIEPEGELEIRGGAGPSTIADGDITPSIDEGTAIRENVGESLDVVYTIYNRGSGPISLTGTPKVEISGPHASDFTVTAEPSGIIPAYTSTSLTLTCSPSASGLRIAEISIPSDDSDENPYNFRVHCSGTTPEINIATVDGSITPYDMGFVNVGSSATYSIQIRNNGTGTLRLTGTPRIEITGPQAGDFWLSSTPPPSIAVGNSSTVNLNCTPTGVGLRQAEITIPNNDTDENPYNFHVQCTGGIPEMDIFGGVDAVEITSGDTTPSVSEGTYLGATTPGAELLSIPFTIRNMGTGVLNNSYPDVTFSGPDATSFDLKGSSIPNFPLDAGESTTFQIVCNPTRNGLLTATAHVESMDSDESPYSFDVQCLGQTIPFASVMVDSALTSDSPSVAVNSSNVPLIAYYESFLDDLKLAICNDSGCTAPTIRTLDSIGDVGNYPSMALNNQGFAVISYFDDTNDHLKLAVCNDAACSSPTIRMIDSVGGVGWEISLALTSSGNPVISYFDDTNDDLKLAICNDPTCTAPTIRTLDSAGEVGRANSVALNSADIPLVAYWDVTNYDLKLAVCNDAACTAPVLKTLDSAGSVGWVPSLELTSSDLPVIAYMTDPNNKGTIKWLACQDPECNSSVNRLVSVSTLHDMDLDAENKPAMLQSGVSVSTIINVIHCDDAACASQSIVTGVEGSLYSRRALALNNSGRAIVSYESTTGLWLAFELPTTAIEVRGGATPTSIPYRDTTPSPDDGTDLGTVTIGNSLSSTFTIHNSGPGELTFPTAATVNSTRFTILAQPLGPLAPGGSTNMTIQCTPTATGLNSATVSIPNNSPTASPFEFTVQCLALAPDITLQGGPTSTNIYDGDSSAYPTDGTHFGQVTPGSSLSSTFTVLNIGDEDLQLTGTPLIEIAGMHASEFSVTVQPSISTLAPEDSTTFTVTCIPADAGPREAEIIIANDDPTETPFNFAVECEGLGAAIEVRSGYAPPLIDGDSTPSTTEGTSLGTVDPGASISREFNIRNAGPDALLLTGSPLIQISGPHAADFSIAAPPTAAIDPGDSEVFTLRCTPSAPGMHSAEISIASNDSNENPFNFTVECEGEADDYSTRIVDGISGGPIGFNSIRINSSGLPVISYTDGSTGSLKLAICNDAACTAPTILTLDDSGNVAGENSLALSSADVPVVSYYDGLTGDLRLAICNDSTCSGPELRTVFTSGDAGYSNSVAIDDSGRAVISFTDRQAGRVRLAICEAPACLTPTIRELGYVYLGYPYGIRSAVALTGSGNPIVVYDNPGYYELILATCADAICTSFTTSTIDQVYSSASASLVLDSSDVPLISYFAPGVGLRLATCNDAACGSPTLTTISNERAIVNSLTLDSSGRPVIAYQGSGDLRVATCNDSTCSAPDTHTLASGPNLALSASLALNASNELYVSYSGPSNANLSLIAPFPGEGEIEVRGGSALLRIGDGSDTPDPSEGTYFGLVEVGSSLSSTFEIRSTGTETINLTGSPLVEITGAHATDFNVTADPVNVLAPGAVTTFTVRCTPSAEGIRTAELSIANDDGDENPFNFNISCETLRPEIDLRGGSEPVSIVDGDGTPSLTDGTDFGMALLGSSVSSSFEIHNTGEGSLNLTGTPLVSISGTHASDFSIILDPVSPIAPAGSTSFSVLCTPSAAGPRTASISIGSNDSNENPYNFALRCTGGEPEIDIRGGAGLVVITDGDTTASATDGTHFGSVPIGGTLYSTFEIHNTGLEPLNLTGTPLVVIDQYSPYPFAITSYPAATVAPGASTAFTISCTPHNTATVYGTIYIESNDATENPYNFKVTCTGIAPEIEVLGGPGLLSITDGSGASASRGTDFGMVAVGSSLSSSFRIGNLGTHTLYLNGTPSISISGPHAAEYNVSVAPANSVQPGQSTTFTLECTPGGLGQRLAEISITNDDANENPFNFSVRCAGIGPEIELRGGAGSLAIANGDSTPNSSDGTYFGAVVPGSSLSSVFTVRNTGMASLSLIGSPLVAISGDHAADFSVTVDPAMSIATGVSTSFTVQCTPAASGQRRAQVSIANSDASATPFTFDVMCSTVEGAEIDLQGGSSPVSIANGDTTPSSTDGTDLGSIPLGQSLSSSFTILNSGDSPLNLTSSPRVAISGTHAADFSVTVQPSSPIASGSSASFTLQCTPSAAGDRTARITIDHDDADKNPYSFDVKCVGQVPAITIIGFNGTSPVSISDGDSSPATTDGTNFGSVGLGVSASRTFRITNSGNAPLNLIGTPTVLITGPGAADFSVTAPPVNPVAPGTSTDFVLTCQPSEAGARSATVSILNNHALRSTYTFAILCTGLSASSEIDVLGGATPSSIVDGDSSPQSADGTHFGTLRSAEILSSTFTLRNTGELPLYLLGSPRVTISGAHASDFSVSQMPDGMVPAGGSTSFTVQCSPSGDGTRTANVSIANDDPNENPYNFTVSCLAIYHRPEINIQGGATPTTIADGDTTPSTSDGTNFGNVPVGGTGSSTFTISNAGDVVDLTLTGTPLVAISGTHAAEFSVTLDPASSVSVGGTTSFTVQCAPTATGTRTASLSIANNDADENPFNFNVSCVGTVSDITLQYGSFYVTDGDTTPATNDGTDFSTTQVGIAITRTFNIRNENYAPLNLTGTPLVSISGTHAADFSVTAQPASVIAYGSSSPFTVQCVPSDLGLRTATISIASNDPNENPFDFAIACTGIAPAPEIDVRGGATPVSIVDGDTSPSSIDGTLFGSVAQGSSLSSTFTLHNVGGQPLNLTGTPLVQISGTNAAEFSVTIQPGSPVAASSSTSFTVQCSPTANGTRSATVSIANDDASENPFNFTVRCTGIAPEIDVRGGTPQVSIPDGSNAIEGVTHFGEVNAGEPASRTFTIYNQGQTTLELTGTPPVQVINEPLGAFSVTQPSASSIAPGASTTFTVTCTTAERYVYSAQLSISSNDGNENPYEFWIVCQGTIPEIRLDRVGDGATTPTLQNGTDFGYTIMGGSLSSTFTIWNDRDGTVNLTGNPRVEISGPHAADFVVTVQPAATIENSSSFTVVCTPSSEGTRSATISIANNDSDENPYDFSIQCSGGYPEIELYGDGTGPNNGYSFDIPNGDTTPDHLNGTYFGAVSLGDTAIREFNIYNSGNIPLVLDSENPITIVGPHASDFQLQSEYTDTEIRTFESGAFRVTCTPSGLGLRTAEVVIENSDLDENPYTFTISCEGYEFAPDIEVRIEGSPISLFGSSGGWDDVQLDALDLGNVAVGSSVSRTFEIRNVGGTNLEFIGTKIEFNYFGSTEEEGASITLPPIDSIPPGGSTTFTVTCAPPGPGFWGGGLLIFTNDPDEAPFITGFNCSASTREFELLGGPGLINVPFSVLPSEAAGTYFGAVPVGSSTTSTFTIHNPGTELLTLGSPPIALMNAQVQDFAILTQPASTIPPGGSTTFTMQCTPSGPGERTTVMRIYHDGMNIQESWAAIIGCFGGPSPEIDVQGGTPAQSIADGDRRPDAADGTSLGGTPVAGGSIDQTYTIYNHGDAPLVFSSVTTSGEFSVLQQPAASVAPGDSTTFTIRFDPVAPGIRSGYVAIRSNDVDEEAGFAVQGIGTLPGIEVRGDGILIDDGDTTPSTTDETDFGAASVASSIVERTFTINNIGSNPLTVGAVSATGDFTVTDQPDSPVAPGSSTTFTVRFAPTDTGLRSGTISFNNSDADDTPFNFDVAGTGTSAPEIDLRGGTPMVSIASGDDTPSAEDGTDFGAVELSDSASRSFEIHNLDAGELLLTGNPFVQISGPQASDYSVTTQPASPIAAGISASFTLECAPSAAGPRSAQISIASSDADENPYTFEVQCTGTQQPPSPAPVLGAPLGAISDTTPDFNWSASTGAIQYKITVVDESLTEVYAGWHQAVDICTAGTCTVSPANLSSGSFTWWVEAANAAGSVFSSLGQFTYDTIPTGAALQSPAGIISDTTPDFSWTEVSGARRYYLTVVDSTGAPVYGGLHQAADICTAGICTVSPATLPADTYYWWVESISDAGSGLSDLLMFTYDTMPDSPGLVGPSGSITDTTPDFSWSMASGARRYYLTVLDSSGVPIYADWHQAGDICSGGICSVSPASPASGTYWWYVSANNDAGNAWSAVWQFTYDTLPASPVLNAPSGSIIDTTPDFSWSAASGARRYYLTVLDATATPVYTGWHQAVDICSGGTCTVSPASLGSGSYWWYVEANSDAGSAWSTLGSFTYDQVPAAPTLLAPLGLLNSPATPAFQWTDVPGARRYYLTILDSNSIPVYSGWQEQAAICAAGTCSASPITLSSGESYWWYIEANNGAGSAWSGVGSLSYLTAPAPPMLISPVSATSDTTPDFEWIHSPEVAFYHLTVIDLSGTVHAQWYAASGICSGASCVVSAPLTLTSGPCWWYVQANNAAGDALSALGTFAIE